MPSTTQLVDQIKADLSKKIPSIDSLSDDEVESCKDMIGRLDDMDINLKILTATLIGTVVSKFKSHEQLGPQAKALVKKWKNIAKKGGAMSSSSTAAAAKPKDPPPAAAAAAATKPQADRRDSVSSDTSSLQKEWDSLPSHRKMTCQKLHDFLKLAKTSIVSQGIAAAAVVDHLATERASEVELAIQKKFENSKSDYLAKARSLCSNIKKNGELATNIIIGHMEADELVNVPAEQLASAQVQKERAERQNKKMEAKQLDYDAQNEDKINKMCGITGDLLKASLFTCGRCKSTKTTSTQKQTRSADEPMTVFVLCLNCGKRWKFS